MNEIKLEIDTAGQLEQLETVLDIEQIEDTFISYSYTAEPGEESSRAGTTIYLTAFDYEELGRPEQVTVRVRKGNALQRDYEARIASGEEVVV